MKKEPGYLVMAPTFANVAPVRKSTFRKIGLPAEHGSWGFLLEPIVAGIAIAFSTAGGYIALATIGAFLARRPFHVLVTQWRQRGQSLDLAALQFFLVYSLIALAGLIGLIMTSGAASLVPFLIASPIIFFQLYTEITRRGRQLTAEIAGAIIMPSSAAAIILAAGGTRVQAGVIWCFFIARFIPSIFYVRNRLNLEKGKHSSFYTPVIFHMIALTVVTGLARANYLPLLTILAFVLLLVRSCIGLSRYRHRVKAMKIGILEIVYGAIVVLSLTVGQYVEY